MLVICYGLQKSASTFCFQLISDVLEDAGYPQRQWRRQFLKTLPASTAGGITTTKKDNLETLLSEAEDGWRAVKTHSVLTEFAKNLIAQNRVTAFATYRCPRDAALSMFEHAERQRAAGPGGPQGFGSKIFTLEDAIRHVGSMLPRAREWCEHPQVNTVSYEMLRTDSVGACALIAETLGLTADAEKIVSKYESGEGKIQNYNVGRKGRFEAEATPEQKALADMIFSEAGWPFFQTES